MDVKSLLEKYANTDECAKKIFDKLLVQNEIVKKEIQEVENWKNKNILHKMYCNIWTTIIGTIILVGWMIYLLFYLNTDKVSLSIFFGGVLLIFIIALIFEKIIKTEPQVSHIQTLTADIFYLNDVLKENAECIKEYDLIYKSDHPYPYIYDEVLEKMVIVMNSVTDLTQKNIYQYRYYEIKESNIYKENKTLEETFYVEEKLFFSQTKRNKFMQQYDEMLYKEMMQHCRIKRKNMLAVTQTLEDVFGKKQSSRKVSRILRNEDDGEKLGIW